MSDFERCEILHVGERVIVRFIDGRITDMECLSACRKLKSVYDLVNRGGASR